MRGAATIIVTGWDAAVAEWVRQRVPEVDSWGPCRAIGIAAAGELVAGVVYNNYRWPSIEASIASTTPAWCSRRNLAAIFAYPFDQLQVSRLGAATEAANQPIQGFLLRLGFRREGVLRQALAEHRDLMLFGMTRQECRWLPPRKDQDVEGRTTAGEPAG